VIVCKNDCALDSASVFAPIWSTNTQHNPCDHVAHAFLQIVAIRPLAVRLVPASTIRPRRANSILLGLTVLAFISSSFVISSSVLGVRHRNSYTRRCMAFSVAGVSESAAAAEVAEPFTLGARVANSGPALASSSP